MLFNSVTYIIFLLIVVPLYWFLPVILRKWLIVFSSIIFYGFWRFDFVLLVLLSTVVDYFIAQKIFNSVSKTIKKKWLIAAVITNLTLLFIFKYILFFSNSISGLLNLFNVVIIVPDIFHNIILPLGISFYTFQTISYSVDVFRGIIKPEKNFILYTCYVMFFPQLVAGPILRAEEVIYQFKNKLNFSINYVEDGIRRILLGLFLKVVLADSISPFVDKGFDINPQFLGAIDVITLAFLFGFQIYFDFSAYSHIAIGTAKLFGLQFPENFNFPYISKSPREFWRRWHISLSSWIRDYLYLPLAGAIFQQSSRGGLAIAIDKKKKNNSLFFTWLLMGLWHGANWNFVFWGFYHYLLIIIYRVLNDNFRNVSIRLKNIVGLPLTLFFSMLSWVFFRADSLQIALQMYSKLLNPQNYFFLGLRENTYIVAFFLLIGTFITYYVHKIVIPYLRQKNVTIAIFETIFMSIVIILVFIYLQTINQFIYFQF